MSLTLYMHPVSTVSRPVRLLIAEKNLPIAEKVIDLMTGEHHKPDYVAINPSKAVPALVDGDFRLTESSAILKYLAAKFDLAEYPKNLEERAQVDSVMDWFNTGFYRDFGYGVLYPQLFPHHKRPSEEQHAGTISWGQGKAREWLSVLDQKILGANSYVANNKISIADYFGVCLLTAGEIIGCGFDAYPNICRWVGAMKKLQHWDKINEVMYGYAASVKGQAFERV